MARQIINIGTTPRDRTGDKLRTAFQKTNENFEELYAGGFVGSSAGGGVGYTGSRGPIGYTGSAGSGPFGTATRMKTAQFSTAYSNANASANNVGQNGGIVPTPVRLMINNTGSGIREWTGQVLRIAIYGDRTNTQLRTEANFIAA